MRTTIQITLLLVCLSAYAQQASVNSSCELFPDKSAAVNKNDRMRELRDLEGDSVVVQILNKKGVVSKEYKGVVSNLSSDITRRANLHTTLMLGERKKNGKISRTQFSTTDESTRIYLVKCED